MPGFRRRGPELDLDLTPAEADLLGIALPLLETATAVAPADPPARYPWFRAHPGDDTAEARFRDLTAGSLEADREADRARFAASLERGTLGPEDAAAWLRVLAEARLVLAGRLRVTEAGWEGTAPGPGLALLQLFGCVQDELATTLLPGAGRPGS